MKREAANKKKFDRALMNAFKEQFQVDVWLEAGDQTDAIPAHKLILVARSKVFRNILESDDIEASLSKKTITLSEMKHNELEMFLEFIYKGSLSHTKMMQHVRVFYLAADKYKIPHLQDLCRNQLIVSMNTRNVFDVLELAKIHSDKILERAVTEFITSNMEEISLLSSESIRGHVNKLKSSNVKVPYNKSRPKQSEREAENKRKFDGGHMNALKTQWPADVLLKAGDQTEAIPAHKLILMAKSKVFRNLLEPDDFKASLSKETITLSEMKHDELETFREFIYDGSLSRTKLVQHVRALYLAADKYEIPHLQDLCRNQLIASMNTRDVFDVLELAKIHSDMILKHAVSEFFASNMEGISSSSKFMSFVKSNPALTVQAIRGHVNKLKRKRQEEK
ncbi:putative BTB/POZ domain-containing protein [Hirschfeldia incana]|nr:putative BTB/POZ domain-containing protein [Hirschfeldia incana]